MDQFIAILIAVVAATPPTVAAILSNRKITQVKDQVTGSNGATTAMLIERIDGKVDSLSRRLNYHADAFLEHVADEKSHFDSTHKLAKNTNKAVNTKLPGAPTIGEQVDEIHEEVVANGN